MIYPKKGFVTSLLLMSTMLVAGCGKTETTTVFGDYMTGKEAKLTYEAYLSLAPDTLNSTDSQSAQNVQHLANFVGTLVMNDSNGILQNSLASKSYRNTDDTEFRFDIRDDAKWVTYNGSDYVAKNSQGVSETQYVKAEDFLTSAKIILDYKNESEIYYMYTLFVNNAWEYYCYTMMNSFIASGKTFTANGNTYAPGTLKGQYDNQAFCIMDLVEQYSGNPAPSVITGQDIPNIANFSRVGVSVNEAGQLVYKLNQSAKFFPTMLTYTPFMPTNAQFYSENKGTYGKSLDKILYSGPFTCTKLSTAEVQYKKNESWYGRYDAQGNETVHINTVNYTVVDTGLSYADMRDAFNNGSVDGFALNPKDTIGWEQYITGPDGTGTIQNPYSSVVNSRELDDVDYTYHFVLNQNRNTDMSSQKSTAWPSTWSEEQIEAQIVNTNNALKIQELRTLVLDGIDLALYNERFNAEDDNQYQINTFTPRGYVVDETGKDYVEYYYEEYAEQRGITVDEARELVGPQQLSGVNFDADQVAAMAATSKDAIGQYNDMAHNSESQITYPVYIEYNGSGGVSPDDKEYEANVVRSWNERANTCTINQYNTSLPQCSTLREDGVNDYPYFKMIANELTNSNDFTTTTENGNYTVYSGWGWIGDYADPLTYAHCYVTNGEMSKQSGNTEFFDSYYLDNSDTLVFNSKDVNHMFAEYNELVELAAAETDSTQRRYELFADAEYMLINELKIMKPSYMSSQGWAASVSRAAGYEVPKATYGLADHMLVGIWILVDVPTGEERDECRIRQETREAEAIEKNGGSLIAIF